MSKRILAVEDDSLCLELIRRSLEKTNFHVTLAADGQDAIQAFHRTNPHLILLDLMLPDVSGWEVCRQIRQFSSVPIIMLTALNSPKDIVRGLNSGADDYVAKPFRGDELVARIQAVLRRTHVPPDEDLPLRFAEGHLVIDPATHRVVAHGQEIQLTPTEFKLLLLLAQQPGRIVPVDTIFNQVWHFENEPDQGYVKWYVWRLRKKIEEDPSKPRFLVTVRGFGYRFQA